jgi:hypothetical protein
MGRKTESGDQNGKTQYGVTPQRFVKVWQTSSTAEEVARRLNMPKSIVHARASNYRQQGIKLKKLARSSKGLDVDGLNRLIEEIDASLTR